MESKLEGFIVRFHLDPTLDPLVRGLPNHSLYSEQQQAQVTTKAAAKQRLDRDFRSRFNKFSSPPAKGSYRVPAKAFASGSLKT